MYEYKIFSYGEVPAEIFNFRYEVYVEELGRPQSYACHDTRTITDPLDPTGYHCVAYKNREIVGCVRLNFVRDGGVEPYFDFYELERLSVSDQINATICTRNMVRHDFRKKGVAVQLLKEVYDFGIRRSATSCFMDVNEPLLRLFEKFGYETQFIKEHPDYGLVHVMKLDVLDLCKLERVKSPFVNLCKAYLAENAELVHW